MFVWVALRTPQESELVHVVALHAAGYDPVEFRNKVSHDGDDVLQLLVLGWSQTDAFAGGYGVVLVGWGPKLTNIYTRVVHSDVDVPSKVSAQLVFSVGKRGVDLLELVSKHLPSGEGKAYPLFRGFGTVG